MAGVWELLATRTGGTVAALAIGVTGSNTTSVFTATAAGLHRSSDAGQNWAATGLGSLAPPVEVVVVSPAFANDWTVFAGTRAGLSRSLDGGLSWQLVLTESRTLALAVSPGYARDGLLFAGTETDGILRSGDGGRSWVSANPGLLDLTVLALALSPGFEEDRTGFAATSSGLYRTRNGGKSWRQIELPLDEPAVQCLAVSPGFGDDRLVLAGTEADGLLRSDDGGATWTIVPPLAGLGVAALAFSTIYPVRGTVAAATPDGIAISHDGGASWRTIGCDLAPVLSLTFASDDRGEVLLAGQAGQGVARVDVEADVWAPANSGLRGNLLVALVPSPDFAHDRTLFTAGLEDGVAVSTDGGVSWARRNEGLADATVFGVAVSPRYADDGTLYAPTADGLCQSRDGAATWRVVPPGDPPMAVRVIAVGPAIEGVRAPVLAGGAAGLLTMSEDDGKTWRAVEAPFGQADVISLAFSSDFARDRTLFVGTVGPLSDTARAGGGPAAGMILWRSPDGGSTWQRWLIAAGTSLLPLAIPASDPTDETVFVGLGGSVMRPLRDLRQTRARASGPVWQPVELPGPPGHVTALAASPNYRADGTVFAAARSGICVSRDGGASFQHWGDGLDDAPIVALAPLPDYGRERFVYALGLGGTIWRRQDT